MVERISNWILTRGKSQNPDNRKEILVHSEKRELPLTHFLSYDRTVADY